MDKKPNLPYIAVFITLCVAVLCGVGIMFFLDQSEKTTVQGLPEDGLADTCDGLGGGWASPGVGAGLWQPCYFEARPGIVVRDIYCIPDLEKGLLDTRVVFNNYSYYLYNDMALEIRI